MKLIAMPDSGLYRAGRWVDVDQFPSPAPAIDVSAPLLDGPRWEDSTGVFATAKFSASAEGAIGRTFARYRRRRVEVDGEFQGLTDYIMRWLEGPPDEGEPELIENRVPPDVFDDLYELRIPQWSGLLFIDLEAPETLEVLQSTLAGTLPALGVSPLEPGFYHGRDRRITRLITRTLWGLCVDGQHGPVAGLRYPGTPDPEWEAFVIWSDPVLVDLQHYDVALRWVSEWDDDCVAAAQRLELDLPNA